MDQIAYTPQNLSDCITYRDLMADKSLLDYNTRIQLSKNAHIRVKEQLFLEQGIKEISLARKKGIKFRDLEDRLISRILVKNFKRSYKIRRINRHEIIRNLISHLKDGSPYNLTRLDIKSFYESIDFEKLLSRVSSEGKISRYNLSLLYKFHQSLTEKNITGLPRGVSLSATLAELCLQDIDSYFLKRKDVFFYSRFVDDILIIHHGDYLTKQYILDYFSKELPGNLELHNKDKLAFLNIPRACELSTKNKPMYYKMDFLGYVFSIYDIYDESDQTFLNINRKVEIDISDKKINKIKDRIMKSYLSYLSSTHTAKDFALLNDRLKLITGNYPIKDPVSGIKINSGIFYNYQHKNTSINCGLDSLDNFLRKLLFSKDYSFSKRLSPCLSIQQKRILSKLTFKKGFLTIRFHTFSYMKLKEMKGCWK